MTASKITVTRKSAQWYLKKLERPSKKVHTSISKKVLLRELLVTILLKTPEIFDKQKSNVPTRMIESHLQTAGSRF